MRPLLPCLLAAACSFGPRVESFTPAYAPGGVNATVAHGDSTFTAELLTLSDTALLLVRNNRIVLARYGAGTDVVFPALPEQYAIRGQPPAGAVREQLRLLSRFPSGISPSLLTQLLRAYRQDSLDVLAP